MATKGQKVNELSVAAFRISIQGCARCGESHDVVTMMEFINPPPGYTHWAICPETGEPILAYFVEGNDE